MNPGWHLRTVGPTLVRPCADWWILKNNRSSWLEVIDIMKVYMFVDVLGESWIPCVGIVQIIRDNCSWVNQFLEHWLCLLANGRRLNSMAWNYEVIAHVSFSDNLIHRENSVGFKVFVIVPAVSNIRSTVKLCSRNLGWLVLLPRYGRAKNRSRGKYGAVRSSASGTGGGSSSSTGASACRMQPPYSELWLMTDTGPPSSCKLG